VRFEQGKNRGRLRLDDPTDWVREEISIGIREGKAVFVVPVGDAQLPETEWSPADCELNQLPNIQHARLRLQKDFDRDFADLCAQLEARITELKPQGVPAASRVYPNMFTRSALCPLQSAPYFAGRKTLLKKLSAWAIAVDHPIRVWALVAAGGTGKTSLAERVLASLPHKNQFGVFVWRFDVNPQTETFLRAACVYFFGEAPKETGGLLERLQHGLRDDQRTHLFILDGLEVVQATGSTGRPCGELEDPLMKQFLPWLVSHSTRTRALITSRFPLPDFADWRENGFRLTELEDLDAVAARFVLRQRGVHGTDAELATLAESVHGHALTVDVLGLYLAQYGRGEPKNAAKFDLKSFGNDQKAERLSKVLTSYAENLPYQEHDLLARLSLFPRGVTLEYLKWMIEAGGEIAGALSCCDCSQLINILTGLRELGLVFAFPAEYSDERTFAPHPFLRDFFCTRLGTTKACVYEAVRSKLSCWLAERTENKPTKPEELNKYEQLIEISCLAGQLHEADKLLRVGLGGYKHLGRTLGEYARGLRLVAAFSPTRAPEQAASINLSVEHRAGLLGNWGMFAKHAGNLHTARKAFEHQKEIEGEVDDPKKNWRGVLNLAELYALDAKWQKVHDELDLVTKPTRDNKELYAQYHGYHATAFAAQGHTEDSRECFKLANEVEPQPEKYFHRVVREALFLLIRGNVAAARSQTLLTQELARSKDLFDTVARCEIILGHCALCGSGECVQQIAQTHLNNAREYVTKSGNLEVTLSGHRLASVIARTVRNFALAESEALEGIRLAELCGFGWWALDIHIELAKLHVADDPKSAIEPAEWVLSHSQEADCQYAWGIADSLHLLGVAHTRIRGKVNKAKAREYFRQAIDKRKLLEHPGLAESESELAKLTG
jgi:hypothetical protein